MDYILLPLFLLMSALCSGLTLAILGLDTFDLKRKARIGDKNAAKVLPIREKGNWTLCTFLISNAAVNSTIPMLLSTSIGTGLIAVAVSTAVIFVFGEVIPQAFCNKYKLQIASATAPLVMILMYITSPLTYPMAKILDKILGKEFPDSLSQRELQEIINETPEQMLDQDEKKILAGGLTFSRVTAIKVMTPINQVFMVELNQTVPISLVKEQTYSRIPVFEETRDNIVGVLYAKDLLGISIENFRVSEYYTKDNLIKIDEKTFLDELLNIMTIKKSHMSFLYDEFGVIRGIVTMEDIVETIINREIIDEHDQIADLQAYAKKEFDLEKVVEKVEELNTSYENYPWGTYGKDHSSPLSWIKLGQCSTEHLHAILDTQHHVHNTKYEIAIRDIISTRKRESQDSFSESSGYRTPPGTKSLNELLQ